MVSTWLQLAAGAPDPHTRADGLLMIAKTNEQVTQINQAVQAVRAAQQQLGEGRSFALPAGREITFHIGDQVLYRRNDRHQQAVTGDPVLNGYRGVVTDITAEGVAVAWRQPGDTEQDQPHTGVCSPTYIAEGGLELGYALTTHKAEGMTVDGGWDRPDGTRNEGDVLVWTPGMDAGGGYVSLSRDRGRTYLFGSLEEVEGEQERVLYGQPRDQAELTERVIAALAERVEATATCADDRPVLVDLGQAPDRDVHEKHTTGPRGPAQQPTAKEGTGQPSVAEKCTERGPVVEVTDAQRQRWDQLAAQSTRARIKGDSDAQRAVEEEQRAYAEELGPERVEVLRQEVRDRLDREAQRAWWQRPHGTLDDTQLAQAVLQAEQRRVAHLAAVEQARAQLAETEPAVTEGRGPAVTQLNTTLAELRRMLELRTRADDVERRWESAGTQAKMVAAHARTKQIEAGRAPWYRPGLRDRRLAEAAELQSLAERAQAVAADLERQRAELREHIGEHWRGYTERTRANVERAEATYGSNLEAARQRDQARLAELLGQISTHAGAADTTEQRRDALTAEHQLRAEMPRHQAVTEDVRRTHWIVEQRLAEQERAAEQQQQAIDRSRDYHYDHSRDPGQDRGFGLGLSNRDNSPLHHCSAHESPDNSCWHTPAQVFTSCR
jgi:hypothetical protein